MKLIKRHRFMLPHTVIVLVSFALFSSAAHADLITDWNERALATMATERVTGGVAPARVLAMMHIAMFEAANAAGVSAEAAVHAAAKRVLAELYPKQTAKLDAAFEAAMSRLAEGSAKAAGISVGERVAMHVVALRKDDGVRGADTYRPAAAPGAYIPTSMPVMSHVGGIKPFALKSVSQFRPGPPPALTSETWTRDYNETKELGAVGSTKRTTWQTETGRFWALIGTHAWNQAARQLASSKPLPLSESARMFALLNIAVFDAYLAIFDAKYHYNFWRPVTAIRNGDRDGNDATERDAAWTPLIATPMHPEYPCAHCVVDGAAAVVLKSVFGSGSVPEITLTYDAMPGVTRKYTSIQQLEDEVSMARIWGGVHYRTSNEVGHAVGKKVGEYVLQNYMRPTR